MIRTENLDEVRTSQAQTCLSEIEIFQLFQEAAKQYEEYLRIADTADIADIADISEPEELSRPKYDWDDPIGLVATK